MNLRLGFFPDFKGADSVLLEGAAKDIKLLSARLRQFRESSERMLCIHDLAMVSHAHPTRLFALRSSSDLEAGLGWLCGMEEGESVCGKLDALMGPRSGHQYFDLVGTSVQLIVSNGEYGESWWQQID